MQHSKAGRSPRVLGIGLGLNTLAIVLLQLPVFSLLMGHRRSLASLLICLMLVSLFFAGLCASVLGRWLGIKGNTIGGLP